MVKQGYWGRGGWEWNEELHGSTHVGWAHEGEVSIGHQVQRRMTLGRGAGHMDETRI